MNTKKSKKQSIQTKTIIYLITFNVLVLIVLWASQTLLLKDSYQKYQMDVLDNIVNKIKNTDDSNIKKTLEEYAFTNDICVALASGETDINIINERMEGCIFGRNNPRSKDMVYTFMDSGEESKVYKFDNEEHKIHAIMYAVKEKDNYVFLYSNLEDLSAVSVLFRKQILIVSVVAIIIAILVSIFLASKITNPIKKITNKAKRLGEGDYKVTFDESGIKEIDELSDTLSQAKEELAKTDELRRDLIANVSHDLKTPLTMIKAYAEMIKDISYKDKNKMDEHLDIIVDETDRLTILVNDILELSKMQANAEVLTLEEFDLVSEIDIILKRYEIIKETEKYHFKVNVPSKAIVYADKKRINQVIYNLVNNAINYTGDDKTVIINVTKNKKDFLVEIIDTGKGIKQEEIPYIWDKYYKKEKKHQRNVVSTGIGLSIVKQILEQHKFPYGVKSEENKGTCFYFKIKSK